jgi:hypothetical protein
MPHKTITPDPPRQSTLLRDRMSAEQLGEAPNDADDTSDADHPTTDHAAEGWRGIPPAQP